MYGFVPSNSFSSSNHFYRFLPNFMYGFVPSNSFSSSNTSLVRRTITKMADKMAAPINLLLWTIYLNHLLLDYLQISYMDYFYQTLGLSDNQDGRQLSVNTFGHSNLVIYQPISAKFHIWTTFIKLLFRSEQDFLQNGYPLFAG